MTTRNWVHWVPVERGDVYCSSACGYQCKKAAHDEAVVNANLLAEQMGEQWQPVVWENMGWFYKVVDGCAEIHPPRSRFSTKYVCFINGQKQFIAENKNPHEAFDRALKEALMFLNALRQEVDLLTK